MPDGIKDFFLHKLTLRVIYIVAAFSASHLTAYLASPKVTEWLSKAGIIFKVQDPQIFQTWIVGTLLIGGEFLFAFFHKKFVLPQVASQEVKP